VWVCVCLRACVRVCVCVCVDRLLCCRTCVRVPFSGEIMWLCLRYNSARAPTNPPIRIVMHAQLGDRGARCSEQSTAYAPSSQLAVHSLNLVELRLCHKRARQRHRERRLESVIPMVAVMGIGHRTVLSTHSCTPTADTEVEIGQQSPTHAVTDSVAHSAAFMQQHLANKARPMQSPTASPTAQHSCSNTGQFSKVNHAYFHCTLGSHREVFLEARF
jgi:hypothetical protein